MQTDISTHIDDEISRNASTGTFSTKSVALITGLTGGLNTLCSSYQLSYNGRIRRGRWYHNTKRQVNLEACERGENLQSVMSRRT